MSIIINADVPSPTLMSFVKLITGSYPEYTFTFRRNNLVRVHLGAELLGELSVVAKYHQKHGQYEQIVLSNKSVSEVKMRRGGVQTKDFKKAVALFAQHFKPQPANKLMEEASSSASNTINWLRASVRSEATDRFNKVIATGGYFQLASALKGVFDLSQLCTVMDTTKRLDSDGVLVLPRRGGYLVQYKRDRNMAVREYTAETLPQNLRASLAMIKMVDKHTVVHNRGARLDDDVFMILEDNNA